jgi:RNA polymerase sigma-70 factor (ECF subfamily)
MLTRISRGRANECVDAFEREHDYVLSVLRRFGARPADVEDLAHDVFLVLLRNWETFDAGRPLQPYLFGIAFRVFSNHRRRHLREVPHSTLDAEDSGPGPEKALQSHQAVAELYAALEHVPLQRRKVLVMHELDGIPILDIANALSITRFGAYARLRKGHKELATALRRLQLQACR